MNADLERLRELRSSQENIRRALEPLQNRFPDEIGIIWWLERVTEDCKRRIEDAKEALSDNRN